MISIFYFCGKRNKIVFRCQNNTRPLGAKKEIGKLYWVNPWELQNPKRCEQTKLDKQSMNS